MIVQMISVLLLSGVASANWEVGDYQRRMMSVGTIPYAAVDLQVRSEEGNAYWLVTHTSYMPAYAPDETKETLIDRASGRMLKNIVNGRELAPKAPVSCEVISEQPETIQVPAGEFATVRRIEKCDREIFVSWKNPMINMNGEARRALLHSGATDPKEIYLKTELVDYGAR